MSKSPDGGTLERITNLEREIAAIKNKSKWPRIYDIVIDADRDVTQEDINRLQRSHNRLGQIWDLLRTWKIQDDKEANANKS